MTAAVDGAPPPAGAPELAPTPRNDTRTVVIASAAGTAFEWYDFFIFGALAATIARNFTGGDDTAGFIFALGAFAAGFGVRPLGALFFGRFGDRVGRKAAFLITITLMGSATFLIGCLPGWGTLGIAAPILLIALRVVQGFALGGEYGGAAIYVAEHAPASKRGALTGWIQTSAAAGLVGALGVILATRSLMSAEAFADWGWRIPFLASAGLLAVSLWIRMSLEESPAFQKIKDEQAVSTAPYRESFLVWKNLRVVLIALVAIMFAQGAVWYAGHFYAQFFLERVLKVEPATVNLLMITAVALSAPLYVFFGWLSDRVGRKPVMLGGMILATLLYFPAFGWMTQAANPALADAARRAPVTVSAQLSDCAFQFDPLGRATYTSACDVVSRALTDAGVSYTRVQSASAGPAAATVGGRTVTGADLSALPAAEAAAQRARIAAELRAALAAAGYPAAAAPEAVNFWGVLGVLLLFMVAATALYGPQAAALVELFPTRIRYTALSVPYHIGTGWVGGFLPFTAFAMVAARGDIYFGLWYPLVFTVIAIVATLTLLPETKGRSID